MWTKDGELFQYAGFLYIVSRDGNGEITMIPVDGQHKAARKEKHIRAAKELYEQEK